MRHVGWLVLFSFFGGCADPDTLPREDFPRAAAGVICDRTRECLRGQFDAAYFGTGDCIAEQERYFVGLVELMDELDCDYDASGAADAYVETRTMSCEDFYEGEWVTETEDIWGDCGRGRSDDRED